jgi:hypothetical protein
MPKTFSVTIPDNEIIPEILSTFSPEENYIMLKIGSQCLLEGRNAVAGLSQKEIYKKIKEESKEEIKKLELNIILEKEITKKMEDRISKIYEGQIEKQEKQINLLSTQIKTYELENKDIINKELTKAREKYELLLQEKDKQNQMNREVFDKASLLVNKNISKSSIAIGDDGENIIECLSETFKDFPGYKIENKAKQGHKGDFHLFFEEFNVLVDSKNYSGSVQKKEVTKIESDLMTNDNMHYAWLVSLNSNICEQNRFPITYKWIKADVGVKCILFINNLLENKDPKNILRQAWSICNEFNKLTKKVSKEDGVIEKYIEKEITLRKHIENLQERTSEIRRSLNTTSNILKHMDNELIEMLSLISDEIVNSKFESNNKIHEWWESNIEYVEDESKLTSTEIWTKFKRENKDYVAENKLTIDIFKDAITSIVDDANYVEKTKKGQIEFIGFKFKSEECVAIVPKNQIMKKIKTEKLNEYYFSKEEDDKILKEYENKKNNIMSISSINNIKPWEVVSLLMKYKVIKERNESRGYEIYKDTEEYKSKIKN